MTKVIITLEFSMSDISQEDVEKYLLDLIEDGSLTWEKEDDDE